MGNQKRGHLDRGADRLWLLCRGASRQNEAGRRGSDRLCHQVLWFRQPEPTAYPERSQHDEVYQYHAHRQAARHRVHRQSSLSDLGVHGQGRPEGVFEKCQGRCRDTG